MLSCIPCCTLLQVLLEVFLHADWKNAWNARDKKIRAMFFYRCSQQLAMTENTRSALFSPPRRFRGPAAENGVANCSALSINATAAFITHRRFVCRPFPGLYSLRTFACFSPSRFLISFLRVPLLVDEYCGVYSETGNLFRTLHADALSVYKASVSPEMTVTPDHRHKISVQTNRRGGKHR